MADTQFTPGPWAVHPRMAYVIPADHADRPIGGAEDDVADLRDYAQEICAIHHPDRHRSEAESRANANLIKAAPKLYAALEVAEEWLQKWADHASYCAGNPGDCPCGLNNARAQNAAALAEARGEA